MFPDFQVVSYKYNALKTLRTAHPQTWDIEEVKNIHYILTKPWSIDPSHPTIVDPYVDLYELWWATRVHLPAEWIEVASGRQPLENGRQRAQCDRV
ncbi:hypothetical protein H310_07155 [Aphanomyces invadans]|uniref:Uncharacterized protein n=1 Tax=Aphanomyces invadans TaxID=157072 RepID=A0A024U2U6_9STRA|nr:hypothetical protein H310_07155 [Aphanomyces invadans]ETW00574.1 hypothetical protein H310_07155 [Aphanomyces invadans]|eukprot:XP_008870709.1 hypothetical protein H310_07155 [Aphanomyces invadans]